MQMQPMMAAYYPNNVTTDHIQQVPFLSSSLLLSVSIPLDTLFLLSELHMLFSDSFSENPFFNFLFSLFCLKQYLDENKSLILKIVESQNSGKLTECAE